VIAYQRRLLCKRCVSADESPDYTLPCGSLV
jgi:hypothetical protein